jgi:Rieske Fe-S protein
VFSASAIAALVQSCELDESAPTTPSNTVTYDVSTNPDLAVVGGITLDVISGLNNGQPVFISRVADESYVVFSAICTHAACTVGLPETQGADCVCPCHGSAYSPSDGHNVKQPTSGTATDLKKFASSYDASKHLLSITT